ncbi:transmembrane protein 156 isoform X2 [Aquarana catesbeiana]|uniref:transmembrane protein 156 isoform X2 n=1 Tax=Aquarana catesbeiana TaxID=8400 RepID=UPI003CC95B52
MVMATSPLLKIFLGIILLCIVCIPEWFTTTEGNTVYLSCILVCFEESAYLSTVVSKSIICPTQENNTKYVQETVNIQNNMVYTVNFSIYINTTLYLCVQQRHIHSVFQDMKIPENTTYFSLEVSGKYRVYAKEESHFTLVNIEDRDPSLPFSFEIHVKNTTGPDGIIDDMDFKNEGMKTHDDFINISLNFERQVPCKRKSASLKRCKDKQNRMSPKRHCLPEDHQKYEGKTNPRSYSALALPTIAEHLETAT